MAGPVTLLTESWKLGSPRHTHDFLAGEHDTRTTFKTAEPKGKGKKKLYQWVSHLN